MITTTPDNSRDFQKGKQEVIRLQAGAFSPPTHPHTHTHLCAEVGDDGDDTVTEARYGDARRQPPNEGQRVNVATDVVQQGACVLNTTEGVCSDGNKSCLTTERAQYG